MQTSKDFENAVIKQLANTGLVNFKINDEELKHLRGWTTLGVLLMEAEKSLKFSEEFYKTEITKFEDMVLSHAMFKNAILSYAKCFSSAGKNKISLNATEVFKERTDLKELHDKLMEVRNTYIAHNDENDFEIALIMTIESDDELVLAQTYTLQTPLGEYKNYYELIEYCTENVILKVNKRIDKIEKKIGKKIVFK